MFEPGQLIFINILFEYPSQSVPGIIINVCNKKYKHQEITYDVFYDNTIVRLPASYLKLL